MISNPMVHLAQTVQLSCIKISTICKQIETSIHLSLITKEYHQVRPKWFLSLWYVWRKPCNYLAPRLAPSPNRMKGASSWASSPRSTIGLRPKLFMSLWYVWRKPRTYVATTLTLFANEPKQNSTWARSPRSSIAFVQSDFWDYGKFDANRAPILRQG
jgi:hypothetical protein